MDEQITRFKLLIKQMILNFKYLFHNKKNVMILTLIPLLSLTLPMLFIPIYYGFPTLITLGVLVPASIFYCSTTYEWRKGTLYPVILTSKNSKSTFYISSFLSMIILAFSLYILIMFVLVIMNQISLLMTNWGFANPDDKFISFETMYLLPSFYSIFEMTLVMFSIFFLFQNIFKTNVTMYSLLFGIVIIQIIFGGMFTQYFIRGKKLADHGNIALPWYKALAFPDSVFWLAYVINPLFAPSMHMQSFSSKWLYNTDDMLPMFLDENRFVFWVWETNSNTFGSLEKSGMTKWNILWLTPYIWTSIFATSGIACSKLLPN